MRKETLVYLNSWYFYNNGYIGFGWMTPAEARDFVEEHANDTRYEELFVADIDNYLGVDFGTLEYCNVDDILDTIEKLEEMDDFEKDTVIAIMENENCNVDEAIEHMDKYIVYSDLEEYHDSCDELIDMELEKLGNLACYFDYDSYHRDCDFDVYEASNGVVLMG